MKTTEADISTKNGSTWGASKLDSIMKEFYLIHKSQNLQNNSRISTPSRMTTMDFNKKNLRKCRMGHIDACYEQK